MINFKNIFYKTKNYIFHNQYTFGKGILYIYDEEKKEYNKLSDYDCFQIKNINKTWKIPKLKKKHEITFEMILDFFNENDFKKLFKLNVHNI